MSDAWTAGYAEGVQGDERDNPYPPGDDFVDYEQGFVAGQLARPKEKTYDA